MRRPLAYVGFSFLFSLILAILTDTGLSVLLILAGLIIFAAIFIRNKRPTVSLTILVISFSVLAAQLYLLLFNYIVIESNSTSAGRHSLVGVVEYSRGTVYGTTTLEVRVTESKTLDVGDKVYVIDAPSGEVGQLISCDINISNGTDATYVGDLDSYMDGVFVGGIFDGEMQIISSGNGVGYFFLSIQSTLTSVLNQYLPSNIAGIAAALVYGDRSGLAYKITSDFRLSGLSHILVVSGLHLSILCAVLLPILNKLIRKKHFVYPIMIAFVIFYTLLCGVRLSVLRAAFVVIMLSLSRMLSRRSDTYTSLGLAALVVTLLNPYSAVDLSLLLSLFATVGILFANELAQPIYQKLRSSNRLLAQIMSIIVTSAAAIAATMPVFAALGDGFSLLAIPANIATALLASPIITLVLLGLLASILPFDFVATIIFEIARLLISLLLSIAEFISSIEWQFINFSGNFPFILLLTAFVAGFLIFLNERPRAAIVAGLTIVLMGTMSYALIDYNTVHVAIVGETLNPVVVLTKNNNSAVIYRATKSNNAAILRYLNSKNLRSIETIVDISHSDSSLDISADYHYNFEDSEYRQDSLTILDNIYLTIREQEHSNTCMVNIGGFHLAIASGDSDFEGYPVQTLVIGGSSPISSFDTEMLYSRKPSAYTNYTAEIVLPQETSEFWIRPNHSYIITE